MLASTMKKHRFFVDANDLAATEESTLPTREDFDMVAHLAQRREDVVGNAMFEVDGAVHDLADFGEAGADAEAGGVEGLLRVHAEGEHVEENLHVALRLHVAAHDAVDGMQALIGGVGEQGGDDGVVGAFAGRVEVWVSRRVEGESGAAVLEHEAGGGGDDGGAEAGVDGVDEGDAVAVLVGDGEVDGVADVLGRGGSTVWERSGRRGCGEQRGARGEVGGREEVADWRSLVVLWIRDEPVGVGEGDTEAFDDCVEIGGGVVVGRLEQGDLVGGFERFEDPERHQGDDALAVRRTFPELHTMIGCDGGRGGMWREVRCVRLCDVLTVEFHRYWRDFVASRPSVGGKVGEREMTAERLDDINDRFGNGSFVETFLAFACETTESLS